MKILAINRTKRKSCGQVVHSGRQQFNAPNMSPMRHYILFLTDNQLSVVQQR
ncbi:hypothetical protein CPB86DRAFT_784210 [Serendipita vermifera]|nr:hypothetical protein CPB86DRAFT_784210 [Serendipita vermifera]